MCPPPPHHRPSPTVTVLPQSLTGSFEEAGAHLQKVLHPTPPSEAARARRGLLRLKKGDVVAAAQDLQCLAEMDAQDLGFLLCLLEASERQSLTQVGTAPLGVPSPALLQHLRCETPRSRALCSTASPLYSTASPLYLIRRHLGLASSSPDTPRVSFLCKTYKLTQG